MIGSLPTKAATFSVLWVPNSNTEHDAMAGISIPDLLNIYYVLVDNWYQAQGAFYLKGQPGAKPVFSNSRVITLMVCMDFIPCPAETRFIEHIRSDWRSAVASRCCP